MRPMVRLEGTDSSPRGRLMIFMSPVSRMRGGMCECTGPCWVLARLRPDAGPRIPQRETRRPAMKWETPSAVDFRFGFEITMYVAAR
ncbi:MAG: pyrroloquinoline quinone precursor peptide PqqA [Porticoccaceae bacterium]|nr:pyrroloquinoline quinone precursor peptide PqqA [Porticoccaceae bacterium]